MITQPLEGRVAVDGAVGGEVVLDSREQVVDVVHLIKTWPSRVSRLVYCNCSTRCNTSGKERGTGAVIGNSSTTMSSRSTAREPSPASSRALIAGLSGVLE